MKLDEKIDKAINLAKTLAADLEEELDTHRHHSTPTRYKQRKAIDWIQHKFDDSSERDFLVLFRMSKRQFFHLLSFIHPLNLDHHKKAVSPRDRLSIFLLFASGLSMRQVPATTNYGATTVKTAINRVASAIISTIEEVFLTMPETQDEWLEVAAEFESTTALPNCVGAIDGKHVRVKKPAGAGTQYWNYKQFHSIILLAVADAKYRFLYVDIGSYGINNDSYVFNTSSFCTSIEDGIIQLPVSKLPNSTTNFPHYFVADDAFQLRDWLFKPMKGENLTRRQNELNYRRNHTCRCIEQAFGILVERFPMFGKALEMGVPELTRVIRALLTVHNFLISNRLPGEDLEVNHNKLTILQARIVDEQPNIENPIALRNELLRYFTAIAPIPEQHESR